MTASPPRGTFGQAELTGERVITRCITRSVSVPGAAIRACEVTSSCCLRPRPASPGGSGGRAAVPDTGGAAGGRRAGGEGTAPGIRVADRAATGAHPPRPSPDVAAWLGWLAEREIDALAAGRVHVDLWAAAQLDDGAAASSARPRLMAGVARSISRNAPHLPDMRNTALVLASGGSGVQRAALAVTRAEACSPSRAGDRHEGTRTGFRAASAGRRRVGRRASRRARRAIAGKSR